MLSAQEIANYLVEKFDKIGETRPELYKFSILSELAKGYDGEKINGMVKTVSADPISIPNGYVEVKYVFAVELFVSGTANRRYMNINGIINEFIAQNQCANVEFENGKGVMTFTLGVPKGYKIAYELGEGTPLTFTVRVTYTENAVTSGDKHWLLDGNEIPYLSESVSVEREGIPRKIYTEVYSKILLTSQTKYYTFRIPYESNAFKSLQTEILQTPAADEIVHTLTYYDGAAFAQDKPYTAKVTIFRSANSSSARPDSSAYEVTFTDLYDATDKQLHYYLALIDFPFDMQCDDTRYFENTTEQTNYFEEKAASSSAPFVEIKAPNLDGLVITKQIYRIPAATALSQFDYVSKNYAVIKVVSAAKTLYFYYFIQNSEIGADGCITVDLKLDTVQTYFFNDDISFSDCLIERAHLNRFVPVEDDPTKVKFVTDPASKIYNSEQGLNFPKRLVQRDKLKLQFLSSTGSNKTADNWLNENVAYWVYIFIDPTHNYNTKDGALTDDEVTMGRTSYFNIFDPFRGATNVISYPVYKQASGFRDNSKPSDCKNIIRFETINNNNKKIEFIPALQGRKAFETLNNDASFYYSIKISCLPPFDYQSVPIVIDGNNNLVIKSFLNTDGHINGIARREDTEFIAEKIGTLVGGIRTSDTFGLFFGSYQGTFTSAISSLKTFEYSLSENEPVLKEEIISPQAPNLSYNPKLNSQNFKELVITASSGDTFAYDVQKLNESSIVFEYSEPIQPEITKYYMRVQGGTGQYAEGTDENYTGLVGSTDTSLMFANDKYAEFLANNKNFSMQSNLKIVSGLIKSDISNGISAVGSALSGDMMGVASAVGSSVSSKIDAATSIIDRGMTIDNMKNAPDQLKNANGNVIFNMFTTDLGLYVEKYSALEGDLNTANNFMNLYGFTVSAVDNIKKYANIRKYHNYIKAQLQSINGNLSNVARADLRQRFVTGVRFWNSDNVSYECENYENWLEE